MLCVGGGRDDKYLVDTGRFRGDKMRHNRTLVRYRTTDIPYPQFVVIPNMFVSDMLRWLSDYECAEIEHTGPAALVLGTDKTGYRLPINWPGYQKCMDYIRTRNLLTETL